MSTAPTLTDAPRGETKCADSLERASFAMHRITSERFERMVEAGILGDKEPIFLWKGRLVEKMTKGVAHFYAVSALYYALVELRPAGYVTFQEQPLRILDDSRPEPDLIVARGGRRDYRGRIPSSRDVALIVEVADSSLAVDAGEVLETYAGQGIPVYWIVNLPNRQIEVHQGPTEPARYRECRHYLPGESVPVVLDGVEVGQVLVDDILP